MHPVQEHLNTGKKKKMLTDIKKKKKKNDRNTVK